MMKKPGFKLWNTIWITLFTILSISVNTYAIEEKNPANSSDSTAAYDERQGLVQVQLVYIDGSNQRHVLKQGCGFFIGDKEAGEYILTNYSTVTLTEEEKNAYLEQLALESGRLDTRIQVIVHQDVAIEFSYENGSQAMDLAILKPGDSLGVVMNLRLSEEEYYGSGTVVHTLGFLDLSGGSTEILRSEGTLEDWTTHNDIHYLKHTIVINGNNKGGPLMNEAGEVIGFNSAYGDGGYYSVQISEVTDLLKTLGIQYNSQIIVETAGLEEILAQYGELDISKYTEESVMACEAVQERAELLLTQIEQGEVNSYTQEMVDALEGELTADMESLKKKGMTMKQIILIFAIIVSILVIAVVILIVLLTLRKRKYEEALEKEKHVSPAEHMNMQGRVMPETTSEQLRTYLPINRSLSEIQVRNSTVENFSETTVLNEGAMTVPEANVLVACPVLVRLKTGDVIQISKNSFVIGKSSGQTDYLIQGNANISRTHICIKRMQDGYYVQDLKATNGTYVDGIRVSWDRDVKLTNGCIIKMADEEFEFKM